MSIKRRNGDNVECCGGIVKLLCVNMEWKNDVIIWVEVFATINLLSCVVAVQTQVWQKTIAIVRESDVLKILYMRDWQFVASEENDMQFGCPTAMTLLCVAQKQSSTVILATNSSAMLTMWMTNTQDIVVALAGHSSIAAVAVSECGNYATTRGFDKTLVHVGEFSVKVPPTEPREGDCIADEAHDPSGKSTSSLGTSGTSSRSSWMRRVGI